MTHPDWLAKRLMEKNDVCKQQKISEMFAKLPASLPTDSGTLLIHARTIVYVYVKSDIAVINVMLVSTMYM